MEMEGSLEGQEQDKLVVGSLEGQEQDKLVVSEMLGQIQEEASMISELSLHWEELEKKLKELDLRALRLEEKEKDLDRKERELSSLDEAVKEKFADLEKRKDLFEEKEKRLEEMVKEFESKQRRFQCKRFKLLADKCNEAHEQITCVDSEFHDFEPILSSSMIGKVWALYDPIDEMPRLYGKIKTVNKLRSSVQVTWLCPKDEEEESVPFACGMFEYGRTETVSFLTLSHEVNRTYYSRKAVIVNPRESETWAVFRDWDKNHKPPYRYDLVEVVKFEDHVGVGVVYLGKVEGFVSVFKHEVQHALIPLEEMSRFSHRVPSVRLSGDEKEGVPVGSFELDPAAVPSSILNLDRSNREEAEETERQSEECSEVVDQDGFRKDIPVILD